jgi:hypothetical protein
LDLWSIEDNELGDVAGNSLFYQFFLSVSQNFS